jgi:hypothetical protein
VRPARASHGYRATRAASVRPGTQARRRLPQAGCRGRRATRAAFARRGLGGRRSTAGSGRGLSLRHSGRRIRPACGEAASSARISGSSSSACNISSNPARNTVSSTGPGGMAGGRRSDSVRSVGARSAPGRGARGAAASLPAAKRACSAASRRWVAVRNSPSSKTSGPTSCRYSMTSPIVRFIALMKPEKRGIRPVGGERAAADMGRA